MSEKPTPVEMPPFIDFEVINRLVYICKITNQLRNSGNPVSNDFELALIHFTLNFKNHVLTDSRLIMLGSTIAQENQEDTALKAIDTIDGVYNETNISYDVIA